jgi:hypothetical protein
VPSPRSISSTCRFLASYYRYFGSALYGFLMDRCAVACEQAGPVQDLFQSCKNHAQPGALAVQTLACVHKLVLDGRAPELARFYPSVGGTVDFIPAWLAFNDTLRENLAELSKLITRPVQINDIDRCAGLLGGFALVARQGRMPLRLLEIGTSGSLNLRWDRYHYQWRGGSWGDLESPVRFNFF